MKVKNKKKLRHTIAVRFVKYAKYFIYFNLLQNVSRSIDQLIFIYLKKTNIFNYAAISSFITKAFAQEMREIRRSHFLITFRWFIYYKRNNNSTLVKYFLTSKTFLLNTLKWIIVTIFWVKARSSYFTNNWVYTTNHKRIAINYFWFVMLAGIVGMVLATIIRLEFAYPGVGVLAGDSIQYLSLASAHGVIMVFFMIMPLLFGAFANFLLPTQLGVHDVAFPRLNSAAFWFLPGGLLLLCQLVCIDRRYQRMNCFNIREVESLLKRRFFVDLINSKDQHLLLNKTAIGLRYKINNDSFLSNNLNMVYNYGLEMDPQFRNVTFKKQTSLFNNINNFDNVSTFGSNSRNFALISYFSTNNIFFFFNNFFFLFLEKSSLFFSLNGFLKGLFFIFLFIKNIFLSIFGVIEKFLGGIFFLFSFFFNIFTIAYSMIFFIFDILLTALRAIKSSIDLNSIYSIIFFCANGFYSTFVNPIFLFINFCTKKIEFFLSQNVSTLFLDLYKFLDRSADSLNKKMDASSFNFKTCRFEIEYAFKDNTFFFNLHTMLKITLNNVFASLAFKNQIYRITVMFRPMMNEACPSFEDERSNPISWGRLVKNSLTPYAATSFMFEAYSLIFFLFNLPVLAMNLFLYIFTENLWISLTGRWVVDIRFWLLNALSGTDVWARKFTNEDRKALRESAQFILDLGPDLFSKYTSTLIIILLLPMKGIAPLLRDLQDTSIFSKLYAFMAHCADLLSATSVAKCACAVKESYSSSGLDRAIAELLEKFDYVFKFFSFKKNVPVLLSKDKSNTYGSNKFSSSKDIFLINSEELSTNSRFIRFDNPVFKYDYKSGDYFSKLYKDVYSFLMPSIIDLTSGLRMPSWCYSGVLFEILETTLTPTLINLEKKIKLSNFTLVPTKSNKVSHVDAFYNFFFSLNKGENISDLNLKWISTNTLNTKFNRMFLTSSLQQRLYGNWRSLKFTREAWRCKMLLTRHQKTLFRRYMHEDGVFWSIERNAKDLIPGWAMITPFSSRTRYTAVGKTDIGLMGVLLVLNSSIISGANFLVTYRYLSTLNNRKMRDARAFFTESIMVSSWMMILANPMLAIGIIMLISDRHWQTSFFDYSGGGDTVLFQHMFWFFGHPEVYIIIIPTFGFTNTMMSYYLKKRVSARASLLYSLYTIAFLGFFVWGHHMYMVGLSHTTRMLFSTLTVMISVPAATKIMHWCVTTANSSFAMELPLLFTFTFIFFFVSGGISGMCVAHTGMDVLFHDTFYVVGHFHVMLAGGAMFASFGAFYFYFPAIFGVKYSRVYAYLHYSYYLIGQLMTVIPMLWLGYAGMPRRVLDYPSAFGGWHSVISAGHMLNVAGLIAFFVMVFDSLRQARAATRNTFGISRYNTRLNFYIYEISRLIYVQQKSLFLFKTIGPRNLTLNGLSYSNFEPYESVLFSYVFLKINDNQ